MKTQTKQNKIIAVMAAVIVLLVALSATLTFAWFTANDSKTSSDMTFGHLTLTVDANDDDKLTVVRADSNDHELVPGCSFTLDGDITVNNNIDTYLRIRVGVKVQDTENGSAYNDMSAGRTAVLSKLAIGNELGLTEGVANGEVDSTNNISYSKWYYIKIDSDAATKTLDMEKISFDLTAATFGNAYQDAKIAVTVEAQAIQAQHLTYSYTEDEEQEPVTGNIADGAAIGTGEGNVTVKQLENATAWSTVASDGVED